MLKRGYFSMRLILCFKSIWEGFSDDWVIIFPKSSTCSIEWANSLYAEMSSVIAAKYKRFFPPYSWPLGGDFTTLANSSWILIWSTRREGLPELIILGVNSMRVRPRRMDSSVYGILNGKRKDQQQEVTRCIVPLQFSRYSHYSWVVLEILPSLHRNGRYWRNQWSY